MTFPLSSWFDLTKRIDKYDANLAESQMMLYAIKDGIDPNLPECKSQYRELKMAVREHNKKFPIQQKKKKTKKYHKNPI